MPCHDPTGKRLLPDVRALDDIVPGASPEVHEAASAEPPGKAQDELQRELREEFSGLVSEVGPTTPWPRSSHRHTSRAPPVDRQGGGHGKRREIEARGANDEGLQGDARAPIT